MKVALYYIDNKESKLIGLAFFVDIGVLYKLNKHYFTKKIAFANSDFPVNQNPLKIGLSVR